MRARSLFLTSSAQSDLDTILDYLISVEPLRGPPYLDRMMSHFRACANVGMTGSPTGHIAPNTHCYFFGTFIAVIRPTDTAIEIIRILHTSRNIRGVLEAAGR